MFLPLPSATPAHPSGARLTVEMRVPLLSSNVLSIPRQPFHRHHIPSPASPVRSFLYLVFNNRKVQHRTISSNIIHNRHSPDRGFITIIPLRPGLSPSTDNVVSRFKMSRRSSRQISRVAAAETEETQIEMPRSTKTAKSAPKSKATKRKATKTVPEEEEEEEAPVVEEAKPKKKRKTAKDKVEDATPLAERTDVSSLKKSMYIGAHVSGAGG